MIGTPAAGPPSVRMRRVAATTSVLLGLALLIAHCSSLPEKVHWFYRYLVFPANKGLLKSPSREYFRMHCWFMLALPSWRLTHALLRTLGCQRALAPLAVLVHLGCWGNNCRWPFLRHPHELDSSAASAGYYAFTPSGAGGGGLHALAGTLPQNDISVIAPYFVYYAAVPVLLPPGFPAALPSLRRCGDLNWCKLRPNSANFEDLSGATPPHEQRPGLPF